MASISIIALPGWGNVLAHGSAPWPLSVAYERSGRARGLLPASPGAPAVLLLPHPHSTLAPRPVRQVLLGALLGNPHAASHGQTPRPPPLGVLFVAGATTAQAPANMHRIGILSPAAAASIPLFEAFRQGLRALGYVEGHNIIFEFRLASSACPWGSAYALLGAWHRWSVQRSMRMYQPCPHCDQPDMSLLRLVLIGEILRAEEPLLVLMADLLHQSGLLPLAEQPPAPSRQRQQGTLHMLRQSGTDHV